MIGRARDFLRAELGEVLGHELCVEQAEAAADQPGRQVHQRHLGSVASPREHTFAEEGSAQRDAIEAAHQFIAGPALDTMRMAHLVQLEIQLLDRPIDPGLCPARA